MTTQSSSIVILAALLALGTTTSAALAQGYGYGSAGGVAAAVGATASPPLMQGAGVRAAAMPVEQPLTTGSIIRQDRTWTQARRR